MQLGICAHPADLAPLNSMPFDFIEAHVQNFLRPELSETEFAPNRDAQLACPRPMPAANCLLPPDLKVTGPSVDHGRLARYAETAFARARSIGMTIIVFGSAGARQLPDGWSSTRGFEQYVEALKVLAPIAQRHGITVVVEPLNTGECNLINTIDEGAEATTRASHPNVRLLVDVFHMLRNGEKPDPIERHAPLVAHAHIAEDKDRAQPGINGDDFRPFLRALRKATLCRRLTLECVWQGEMPTQVGPALAELRKQLGEAGY